MPSPFPGMNPYLEDPAHWQDFHGSYLYRLRVQLAGLVRPRYVVRLGENVYLKELPDEGPRIRTIPDVSVFGPKTPAVGIARLVAAPARAVLTLPAVEEVRQGRLEVLERDSMALVTVLELLSPSNKFVGPDRDQYLTKRNRLLLAGVGFVEIDLLRAGPRTVAGLPECDYLALVARRPELPTAGVWPVRLADPLPAVPVPLRPGEAEPLRRPAQREAPSEPLLDLQAALHAVYDEVGYGDFIYRAPPDPPLTAEQAAWAATHLPAEGR